MAWKCPNCETLNQDPNCVICGAAKPAENDVNTAPDDNDINDTEPYDAIKSSNRRKSQLALIVIIVGMISICVIGAVTALALSNINDRPVSSVTDLPAETSVPPDTQPQSGVTAGETDIQTEENNTETAEVTEPATLPETKAETEPGTEKPSVNGEIQSVSLNKSALNLKAGEKSTLYGTIKHTGDLIDNTVTWSSSNTRVAAVTNGTVTAVGPGKAVISVYTVNGKTDECTVHVTAAEATGISLSAASVTLSKGSEYTLTATVYPENAADQSLTWTTSDAGVVRCDNGVLNAAGVGKATVTVRTTNGKSASCAVTVTSGKITASSVTLDENERTIKVGESFTLSAEVMPDGAADNKIIWTSSNKQVAECIGGRVTARTVGVSVITAKTTNGKKATCIVTVTGIEAESVTLSDVKLMLNIGDIVTLTAFITPEATTDKTLTWESGNTDIVSCDKGKLTAKAVGTAYITVLTSNGKEAICTVTVAENEIPVKSVALDASTLTLEPGDLYTFTATVNPQNATDTDLTWLSDNAGVLNIVGSDGAVLAVQEGSAVITVTSSNGKSASCTVTVKTAEPESNPESDFAYNISGGGAVIISYIGTSSAVIVPEKIGEYYVTAIGDSAFYNKTITSIKIPAGVKSIGNFAFGYCTLLNNIIIPEGIEIIGDYAFAACAMSQFALPSTVGYIGEGAFGQCSNLQTLTIAAANPYFAVLSGVLYNKDITELICFPAGLSSTSSGLPVTLTKIGSSAFFGCFNLSTIVIPQNVTVIGNLAFAYCGSMTAAELPSGLVSVGADAFSYCGSLVQIIIPSTLTRIEERIFIGCSKLTSAVLSENVTFIADGAFTGCNSLVITCPAGSYAEQYAVSKGIALDNGNP